MSGFEIASIILACGLGFLLFAAGISVLKD